MDGLDELIPEDILLKWVNFHLEKANHPRRVTNFGSDIKVSSTPASVKPFQDSVCYIVLLNQLRPDVCSLDALQEPDLLKRARLFLETADKIKCKKFINSTDIVKVALLMYAQY